MPHRQHKDYYYIINTLKLSAESAPNELRLVWLFEILTANVFIILKEIDFIDINNIGAYYARPLFGLIRALGNFRNAFVHHGSLDAHKAYMYLEEHCKEQIEALALEYDIELDWSNTIYYKEN